MEMVTPTKSELSRPLRLAGTQLLVVILIIIGINLMKKTVSFGWWWTKTDQSFGCRNQSVVPSQLLATRPSPPPFSPSDTNWSAVILSNMPGSYATPYYFSVEIKVFAFHIHCFQVHSKQSSHLLKIKLSIPKLKIVVYFDFRRVVILNALFMRATRLETVWQTKPTVTLIATQQDKNIIATLSTIWEPRCTH